MTLACALCALAAQGSSKPVLAGQRANGGQIAAVDPRVAPPVRLRNLHTGERLELRLFDGAGHIRTGALTELRQLMRCVRTGNDHPIHWRLSTILVALAAHYPGRVITVVSGFRDPSVSKGTHRSNHTRGRAIDLRVEGVENRDLRDVIARSFQGVGVGYYPNSSFIHVDIREPVSYTHLTLPTTPYV